MADGATFCRSSSAVTDGVVEKMHPPPPPQPRQLHASRSTNNVLTGVTTRTAEGGGEAGPYRERKASEPASADLGRVPLFYRHSAILA
jgi:hypothetical protein